jgi:hypothetical protein
MTASHSGRKSDALSGSGTHLNSSLNISLDVGNGTWLRLGRSSCGSGSGGATKASAPVNATHLREVCLWHLCKRMSSEARCETVAIRSGRQRF